MSDERIMASNTPADSISVRSNDSEIIRIAPDGRLFWHGREVETDDDFRAAMLELAKALIPMVRP